MKKFEFCILYFFISFATFTNSQNNVDNSTMQILKSSLNLTSDVDWSNPNPCEWDSVQCDRNNRILTIQLKEKGIHGTLPPEIQNLSQLTVLELFSNQISGPIPDLSRLSHLQTLNLHDNLFTSVPNNLFSSLNSIQEVYLNNNPFSNWEIPETLKEATSLKNLSLSNCSLTGTIPEFFSFQYLPSLINLQLSHNYLQGELPKTFAGSSLHSLFLNGQLGETKLNGSISVLQNMTSLQEVSLQDNAFSGPIPDLSSLQSLRVFNVRKNHLTGLVPESLIHLKSLTIVNLTSNFLQGPIPLFNKFVRVDNIPNLKQNSFCLNSPGLPCDPRVDTLLSFAGLLDYPLKLAMNWKGNDPCVNWIGITCSGSNVTVVNLRKQNLSGTISPSLAKLTSSEIIILSDNNLTGSIPTELTSLPKLRTLDVSNNNLSGELPNFRDGFRLVVKGNVNIQIEGTSYVKTIVHIVGGIIGVLCLVGINVCLYATIRNRLSRVPSVASDMVIFHPGHSSDRDVNKLTIPSSNESSKHLVESGNLVISIHVLRSLTNNFSAEKMIGRGGFGTVYMGEFPDGRKVAVKRMESSIISDKVLNEFKSEVNVLTKMRHRNLVALLGYCLDGHEKILVYEYMPQGTLSQHLFHWKEEGLKPLDWTTRLVIALDVARGVEYLHTLAHQSFIHRDLKPSNILLGDDMRAKVSDFGLVRLAPDGKYSIATQVAGTFGYLAPEYAVTGRVTTKVDIFSLGVILMELITGRKALDQTQPEDSIHVVTYFRRIASIKDENAFKNAIDPSISIPDVSTLTSIEKVWDLAGHCCAREPSQRPDISHIVTVLSLLTIQWKPTESGPDDPYANRQAFERLGQRKDASGFSSTVNESKEDTQTSVSTGPYEFTESFTYDHGR